MATQIKVACCSPDNGYRSYGHLAFYQVIQQIKVKWDPNSSVPLAIVTIFGIFVVMKIAIVINVLRLNRRNTLGSLFYARIYLRIYVTLTLLSITLLMHFQTYVTVFALFHMSWWIKPISFLLLISTPLEVLANMVISHDYGFVKHNKLQGRDYLPFSLRVLGLWVIAVISYAQHFQPEQNHGMAIFVNLLHVGWALLVMALKIRGLHCISHQRQTWVQTVMDCIWVMQALFHLMQAPADLKALPDFDVMLFPGGALPVIFLYLLHKRYWVSRLFFEIKKWNTSSSSLALVDLLHYCFRQQDQDANCQFYLAAALVRHTSACCDPTCLCFMMNQRFDRNMGIKDLKGLKEIYSSSNAALGVNKGRVLGGILPAQEALRNLKLRGKVITAKFNQSEKLEIIELTSDEKQDSIQLLDYQDSATFKLLIGSLLRKLVYPSQPANNLSQETSSEGASVIFASASLVFAYLSFLTFESKNYITSLFTAYDWMYSKLNKKDKSAVSGVILQNYVRLAKQKLRSDAQEWFGGSHLELDWWRVLEYQTGINRLQQINRTLIANKIELYTTLVQKTIDYRRISRLGTAVAKETAAFRKGLLILDRYYSQSVALNYERVVFELCALEKLHLSQRTKKNYLAAVRLEREHHQNFDAHMSESMKRFCGFDSSHVAAFARCRGGKFFFKFGTRNGSELFGVSVEEMKGCSLNQFMPEEIGKKHDGFMMNYLSGVSESNRQGRIPTVVISKSRALFYLS